MEFNEGYNARIDWSSGNITKVDEIRFTSLRGATSLEKISESGLLIFPANAAVVAVHNERARGDKDYNIFCIKAVDGTVYYTSSKSFLKDFMNYSEILGEDLYGGEIAIEVLKAESRNYSGKYMLLCGVQEVKRGGEELGVDE